MSETIADFRLDRLESDVHGMKAISIGWKWRSPVLRRR